MTTTPAEALANRDEYAGAIATALGAAAAYYGSGDSALDDASFDLLMGLIQAYEERYPEHAGPASPTGKAAGGAVPAGDVARPAEPGPVVDRPAAAGVNLVEPRVETPDGAAQGPLTGQTVVVTGKMTGSLAAYDTRDKVRELIERAGGTSSSGMSGRTTLLVAGEKAGSKVAEATEAGVEILGEEAFAERIAAFLAV